MRGADFPVVKDIVLLGGGHAHVSVLRNFGMFPINGARLTLISPEVDTPYSGMLPGLIAGHYTFDEAHIDLAPLAQFANARFFETSAVHIDPVAGVVHCADGRPPVAYDVLSINTGSTPVFDPKVQIERDVIPVKPVSEFLDAWAALKERMKDEPRRRIGIVGAGAGGIELLLSMQFALAEEIGAAAGEASESGAGEFHIFTRDDDVLKTHGAQVQAAFQDALVSRRVNVHTGFDVRKVDEAGVSDEAGRHVELDEVIWVTGAQPPAWFRNTGLDVDERGFVAVDDRLRSTSHPDVFGAGDCVSMMDDPRPKSGVFAVRQGPVLAANVRARVLGQPLKHYRAQRAFLSLISTGDQFAVASHSGFAIKGEWVWRIKDRIDRAFMTKFNELPAMEELPDKTMPTVVDLPTEVIESQKPDAMRCGGCGAKVGAVTLQQALAYIGADAVAPDPAAKDDGVVLGVGDDAAVIQVPSGQMLAQTVDSFPAMIDDPFVFGQITANHCLGDIYAMGAKPHSALVVAALPFAPEEKRGADLVQMLAGLKHVLDEAGCRIIGGHTAESPQLTLGLSVNGLVARDRVAIARKGGLVPGQALVLTKPIGTGALFAANGRGRAKGRWVKAAIEHALISNAAASEILRDYGAKAMTDVTGFGLVGHLSEMLAASNADTGVNITLSDVPLLAGAVEIVGDGIVSSLQRENLARRGEIDASQRLRETEAFQLLFDPQTAGGLLAAVPEERASAAVAALHEAGFDDAAVIAVTTQTKATGNRLRVV